MDAGPSRSDFESDAEGERCRARFHEPEVSPRRGFPIARDERGRQYVPGEITVAVDESVSDQSIHQAVEGRGLHVAGITRVEGSSTIITVYSDDLAANPDEMTARFENADGFTAYGPSWAGNVLDGRTASGRSGGPGTGGNRPARMALSASVQSESPSPSDPLSSEQLYLATSNFAEAWDASTCDGSVGIAVIDTEIGPIHPDLSGPLGTLAKKGYSSFGYCSESAVQRL